MAKFIKDGNTLIPAAINYIGISNDGQQFDLFPKANIKIGTIYQLIPNWNGTGQGGTPGVNYPYPTKTIITVTTIDAHIMYLELQDLLTGGCPLATYNDGTKLSLETAAITMASW